MTFLADQCVLAPVSRSTVIRCAFRFSQILCVCSDGKWSEIQGIDVIPPDLTLSGKTGTRGRMMVAAGKVF